MLHLDDSTLSMISLPPSQLLPDELKSDLMDENLLLFFTFTNNFRVTSLTVNILLLLDLLTLNFFILKSIFQLSHVTPIKHQKHNNIKIAQQNALNCVSSP